MFKSFFLLGILTGVFSSLVGGIYTYFFYKDLFDFSSVLPIWKIVAVYFSLGLIASGLYFMLVFFSSKYGQLLFNIKFVLIAVLSVLIPINIKVPNVEFPEIYPVFALPLHLFFSVIFLALSPLIIKKNQI